MSRQQADFIVRKLADLTIDMAYYFCIGAAATLGALSAIVWVFGRVPWP